MHVKTMKCSKIFLINVSISSEVVSVPDAFIIKKLSGFGDLPVHSVFLCPHSGADQNNFIARFYNNHTYCQGCFEMIECF